MAQKEIIFKYRFLHHHRYNVWRLFAESRWKASKAVRFLFLYQRSWLYLRFFMVRHSYLYFLFATGLHMYLLYNIVQALKYSYILLIFWQSVYFVAGYFWSHFMFCNKEVSSIYKTV